MSIKSPHFKPDTKNKQIVIDIDNFVGIDRLLLERFSSQEGSVKRKFMRVFNIMGVEQEPENGFFLSILFDFIKLMMLNDLKLLLDEVHFPFV